jgi:hypothetical protein
MSKYKIRDENHILLIEENLAIPCDTANKDYQEYLEWLEEGNTPLPPDPIPEPESLTPQQKLQQAGLTVEELKELLGL